MYSTCTFCHAPLGTNEVLEHFPVGRKLAFDQARGRLWVVCTVCRQWNLTPLEDRWEAIEEGERAYHDAGLRTATDQIGLARLRDGTELIRVGQPLLPEFAAWRYGERFAKRWQLKGRMLAIGGGALALTQKVPIFIWTNVYGLVGSLGLAGIVGTSEAVRRRVTSARVVLDNGRKLRMTQAHVQSLVVRRMRDVPDGWELEVQYDGGNGWYHADDPSVWLRGPEALRVAQRLLPRLNRGGGPKQAVEDAVTLLSRQPSVDAIMRYAGSLGTAHEKTFSRRSQADDAGGASEGSLARLRSAPPEVRLAVEMALHEETERIAMAGELALLEDAWRDAEEIATISDSLLTAPTVLAALERLKLR